LFCGAEIVPNITPFEDISDADGIVLSGGAPRIGLSGDLGNCGEYLEKAECPILGICAGHQFMARYFGGECEPAKIPEFGRVEISITERNDLFAALQGAGHETQGKAILRSPVSSRGGAYGIWCTDIS